ncbi:O-antigen ligase family protein [Noviherbaspirillum sp.]|uniref:O-antigen ligase family protein n=1 Tax=Noviherbaspirillum sp. TaxID=1926288 RepID=UPI002FE41C05
MLKSILYAVLLLVALLLLASRHEARASYRAILPIVVALGLYLPYSLLSIWLHQGMVKSADNGVHFLYFVIIAVCFLELDPRRLFWFGISAAAIGAGVLALYQRFELGLPRPYGMYGVSEIGLSGAIKFAMVTTLFSLLALSAALNRGNPTRERLCHGAAALVGFAGCQVIASRGPWLVFVLVACGMGIVYLLKLDKRRMGIALLTALISAAFVVGVFYAELHERVSLTVNEISSLQNGDLNTSLGARIAMWKAALAIFSTHPFLGIGLNKFGVHLNEMIAAGQAPAFVAVFGHTHNEYLEALVTGGIIGLAYLLWLLGAPLVFFVRRLMRFHAAGVNVAAPAGGLITVICFALFALSDNIFDRQMTTSLYAFLILGFAVMAMQDVRSHAGLSPQAG